MVNRLVYVIAYLGLVLIPFRGVEAGSPTRIDFAAPVNYSVGRGPVGVVVADLNSDGAPDLITTNRFDENVSVLLNRGSGIFDGAINVTVGDEPVAIATADLDGNDTLDLVVVNHESDNISILLGNGNGTFQGVKTYAVGMKPTGVAIADINRDASLDLAVSNDEGGDVSVFLGNGAGRFRGIVPSPTGEAPTVIALADLNDDQMPDLITASYDKKVLSVSRSQGDGTFQPLQSISLGNGPASIKVADLDGDGVLDVLLATTSLARGSLSLLLGKGDGTLEDAVVFAEGRATGTVVVTDLNNDLFPDLLVTRSNFVDHVVTVFPGRGDGMFPESMDFPAGKLPLALTVSDLNGDGLLDLVTGNYDGDDISVLLGRVFLEPVPTATIDALREGFADADADRDGLLSLGEAQAIVPGLSLIQFEQLDTNSDGGISGAELEAQAPSEGEGEGEGEGEAMGGGCPASKTAFLAGLRNGLGDLFLLGISLVTLLGLRGNGLE